MRSASTLLAVLLLAAVSISAQASQGVAETWLQLIKLTAPDRASGDFFGVVALEGAVLAVGAPFDDDLGSGSGAVYVHERDGSGAWRLTSKVLAPDGQDGDLFGLGLAVSGDSIFAGTPISEFPPVSPGTVYVFGRDESTGLWLPAQNLGSFDGQAGNDFGVSIRVSGGTLAVGAPSADDLGAEAGAVYTYDFDDVSGDWLPGEKLLASNGSADDDFGATLDIEGDLLAVGVSAFSDVDSVYVFERDDVSGSWLETGILTSGVSSDFFGSAVAVGDALVAVGAENDDDAADSAGAVYLYERAESGGWVEVEKLLPPDPVQFGAFGRNVAIDGDLLVVADTGDKTDQNQPTGSIYLFRRDLVSGDWEEAAKLVHSDRGAFDHLGVSIAVSGTTVAAGSDDDQEGDSGAAYVFDVAELGSSVTGLNSRHVLCRNVTTGEELELAAPGTSWDCAAAGLSFVSGDEIRIRAIGRTNGSDVSGAVAGLETTAALCENRTQGASVFVPLSGQTTWDCEREGLPVAPGDRIVLLVRGIAP